MDLRLDARHHALDQVGRLEADTQLREDIEPVECQCLLETLGLAIAAAESGRRVYYGTLGDLITSLEEANQTGRLLHRMKTLGFPSLLMSLLIVDEIGYLPISRTGAMLFFQLMSRRYELASTVLTSNKGLGEHVWFRLRPGLPARPCAPRTPVPHSRRAGPSRDPGIGSG